MSGARRAVRTLEEEVPINIVLTGFMGTGKSTVGRWVAHRLDREFIDTDAEIERQHGPIPELFAEHGEEGFRQLERAVAAELGARRGLVISTGGRLMLDETNIETLGSTAEVYCLAASPDEIVRRVTGSGVASRPLLADGDPAVRVRQLLAERAPGYARFPQISTEDRTVDQIATEIINLSILNRR